MTYSYTYSRYTHTYTHTRWQCCCGSWWCMILQQSCLTRYIIVSFACVVDVLFFSVSSTNSNKQPHERLGPDSRDCELLLALPLCWCCYILLLLINTTPQLIRANIQTHIHHIHVFGYIIIVAIIIIVTHSDSWCYCGCWRSRQMMMFLLECAFHTGDRKR